MKQFVLGAMLLFIILGASAQNSVKKGIRQFNLGVGLSGWGTPVYFGYDQGISNDITLGLETSLRFYKDNYEGTDYNHVIMGILANANFHFNRLFQIPNSYDLYAGLNVGEYSWSSPASYNGSHTSGLSLGAQVGGRYLFSPKLGLNLEFSGTNAFAGGKFGLTFRL